MPFEAEVTRAVTRALAGAGTAVDFAGAQTGDVCIGYVAGRDVVINLKLNILVSGADGCRPTGQQKKSKTLYTFRAIET